MQCAFKVSWSLLVGGQTCCVVGIESKVVSKNGRSLGNPC